MFKEFKINIVLIGFMGSGKTSIAQSLSKLLNRSWIEMDDLVYQKTNTRNMHEVFKKGGELLLRETEIEISKEYAVKNDLIISTGGGVVLNKIVLDYFKQKGGRIIFLQAQFTTIVKRLKGDESRPLFTSLKDFKKLYSFRLPLYVNYADEIINVDFKSVDEIALGVVGQVQNF